MLPNIYVFSFFFKKSIFGMLHVRKKKKSSNITVPQSWCHTHWTAKLWSTFCGILETTYWEVQTGVNILTWQPFRLSMMHSCYFIWAWVELLKNRSENLSLFIATELKDKKGNLIKTRGFRTYLTNTKVWFLFIAPQAHSAVIKI